MFALQENFPKLTPTEYLEWEEKQELRYEYVNGQILARSGGTVNHGEISVNFVALLNNYLRGMGYRIVGCNVKVQIEETKDYLYPDGSVTCDSRDKTATKFASHPCLIVEVLSPSTEARDRWEKFNLYRRSDALQDYVLVDTNKVEIALYSKNDRGKWEISRYAAGDMVELKSINFTFAIEQLYEDIIFQPES